MSGGAQFTDGITVSHIFPYLSRLYMKFDHHLTHSTYVSQLCFHMAGWRWRQDSKTLFHSILNKTLSGLKSIPRDTVYLECYYRLLWSMINDKMDSWVSQTQLGFFQCGADHLIMANTRCLFKIFVCRYFILIHISFPCDNKFITHHTSMFDFIWTVHV